MPPWPPVCRFRPCFRMRWSLSPSNSTTSSNVKCRIAPCVRGRPRETGAARGANVLRLASPEGTRIRDMPRTAGVSKEAIATSLSFLEKRGYAAIETEAASRFKRLVLTPRGRRGPRPLQRLDWNHRGELARPLRRGSHICPTRLPGTPDGAKSAPFSGLTPPPGGWRASLPKPVALPDYPMILHRGGFPDGS
jgi:hypothetical protein